MMEVINDNPESTILIEKRNSVIRIDVGEYGEFETETGADRNELQITSEEREREKRRKDIKLQLKKEGVDDVKNVYTISRIGEDDDGRNQITVEKDRKRPGQ